MFILGPDWAIISGKTKNSTFRIKIGVKEDASFHATIKLWMVHGKSSFSAKVFALMKSFVKKEKVSFFDRSAY